MKDILLRCNGECSMILFQYHLDTFQPKTMIIFVGFRSERQTIRKRELMGEIIITSQNQELSLMITDKVNDTMLFQRLPMMEIQSPCVRSLYFNIPQLLSPMGERGCGIFGWICKVVAMLFLRRQYYIVTFYSWIKNIFFIKGKNTTPT